MIEKLLEIRKIMKERKPEFIRQDNPKRMKLNYKWRKPKGLHSKIRHHFKGRRKMPSPGYKSPAIVKGLHSTGLMIIHVASANDVVKIKKDREGIIVSKSVGTKKKLEIFRKAKELDVKVLNINIDEHIKKIEDFINSKKSKSSKETKKEEKKEKSPKESKEQKHEQAQKDTDTANDESRKEAEKKEKDKLLTKRT